jgi:hypothetical protein
LLFHELLVFIQSTLMGVNQLGIVEIVLDRLLLLLLLLRCSFIGLDWNRFLSVSARLRGGITLVSILMMVGLLRMRLVVMVLLGLRLRLRL